MNLPNSTALISGASRGLGKHLARQLTRRGARVYGGARNPGTLDTSTGVIPVQLDMAYCQIWQPGYARRTHWESPVPAS
jgi:NAD(P)-dependent dehydrogenase (short-subunit alcohol dehydrogenase family)